MTGKIIFVIINFRSSNLTVDLCRSLAKLELPDGFEVLIVDNASNEESRRALNSIQLPGLPVRFLFESHNHGYFGGARCALEFLRRETLDPDWLIVSNSDILIQDPKFFVKMTSYKKTLGALAPAILSPVAGGNQNPFLVNRPSKRKMHLLKWIYRWWPVGMFYELLALLKGQLRSRNPSPATAAQTIYGPHGSFLILGRAYLALPTAFQHQPFLFGEEITVAEQCRLAGLPVLYEPELEVFHVGHATMGALPSRQKLKWLRDSTRDTADRYF